MNSRQRCQHGFTLIELLLVVAIVGILGAMAMPRAGTAAPEQLRSAAHILASDLFWARGLAVANDSKYRATFDVTENRYVITHSGTNTALDTLPELPFRSPTDPANQYIVRLSDTPSMGASTARLAAAGTTSSLSTTTAYVEFGPLGETTASAESIVWLTAGSRADRRFIAVRIDPISGIAWEGEVTNVRPPSLADPDAAIPEGAGT